MRAKVRCLVVAICLLASGAAFAAESPPGGAQPDSGTTSQPATPASPQDIQPGPQVPVPKPQIPSPIAPSEKPTDYIAPPVTPVPETEGDYVGLWADDWRTTFDEDDKPALTTLDGNVTAHYKDVIVTASKGAVDHKTNLATFEGNVVFRIGVQEARSAKVTLDLSSREWNGVTAITTITPEFARGWLEAPIFAQGQRLQGFGQRQVNVFDGEATTCNLPFPHYDLTARSIAVFPNNKAVLRKVTVYALGRRLFTIPRLVIPLRDIQKNPNIIPRVGQTQEEGYFLKTQYAYAGTKALAGFLLLDLMSKKGFGKGIDQSYQFATMSGNVQLYQIFDKNIQQNTFTGRASHSQQLGTLRANIATDFRSNSYLYAPTSQSINSQLTITRDRPGANTSLVFNQNINDTFQRSTRLAGNFKHRQQLGSANSLDTNFDYTAFNTNGTRARLTSQANFTRRESKFDWSISAQKLTDLSDEAFVSLGGFAGIEKLPEVGITTDDTRIGHVLPFGLPARMKLTYGAYDELPSPTSLNRTYFELNTPVRRYDLTDTWTFGAGAGFKQYAYSDDTAQYSFDSSAELSKRLGETSSFDLTYRYQRPRGFTPFRFDFVGRYNTANASLNFKDSEKIRFSLLSGYNFEQEKFPWQDAVLRLSLQPSPSFLLYTATGYDINRSQWRTLINQVRIRASDRFKLDIGTRYDTIGKQLAEARLVLDTKLNRLWRLQANAGYNGFTNDFDYRSVMLIRDLHCWEASLTYINQGGFYRNEGFQFSIRIKAFPYFRDYGAGAFGQQLDTSVGQVY